MTRSEEQLRVGTETVEGERARLRKYVVTENVSTTVPVSHEEVRVERESITDANRDAALSGEPISEEEHEVTLRAERPVVAKEAVPVERVRLATEAVTEDAAVSETVRRSRSKNQRSASTCAALAVESRRSNIDTGWCAPGERTTACSTQDDTTDQPSVHPGQASAGAAPGPAARPAGRRPGACRPYRGLAAGRVRRFPLCCV
jgi:uncharacterized protein (TIGR02271 family)